MVKNTCFVCIFLIYYLYKRRYGMCDKTSKHWESFVVWARNNGIEFRHPEDYGMWWKCWYAAATSEKEDV